MKLGAFFTENGILGIVEATDFESVGLVSPFLGEIVDTLCGDSSTATVTKVF